MSERQAIGHKTPPGITIKGCVCKCSECGATYLDDRSSDYVGCPFCNAPIWKLIAKLNGPGEC